MKSTARLSIVDYYLLESLSAIAVTIFTMGIFFWTTEKFHYTPAQNLLLMATLGFIYIFSSRYGGKLADHIGYDRLLLICMTATTIILGLGWLWKWKWAPFVIMALYTLFTGPTWPALEAAILQRPANLSMPSRLGIYNILWGVFDAVGYFAVGWLVLRPDSILWVASLIHAFEVIWICSVPRQKTVEGESAVNIPHEGTGVSMVKKDQFMRLGWLGNSLAFLMMAGFVALAPQLGGRLGMSDSSAIWLSTTLLLSRGLSFLWFWKWEGWHYRTGWLQLAIWSAPLLLAGAFFIHHVPTIILCLSGLGISMGLAYSASIYYSLDYGDAQGEHGGLHESMLGMGMFAGPLLASFSSIRFGATGAAWTVVLLVLAVNLLGNLWISRAFNKK